jgi:hypothetical protein
MTARTSTGSRCLDREHHRGRQGLVRLTCPEDNSRVDQLHQLFARSKREIEAHAPELSSTETGSYLLDQASRLLAALRLWAQTQYRTDQVVREALEAGSAVALNSIARELQQTDTPDGRLASRSIAEIASRPSGEQMTVASYALRAL